MFVIGPYGSSRGERVKIVKLKNLEKFVQEIFKYLIIYWFMQKTYDIILVFVIAFARLALQAYNVIF